MKVVYNAFTGRYSDSPRALYEANRERFPGQHVWVRDPRHAHGFPPGTATVDVGTPAYVAALEDADLVVSNTHIEVEWDKPAGALYLQTWHGTPLKRIHHDALWAPPGRLARLDRDVARWDHLVSPNRASTERLRGAFDFRGEVLETGYPRNDVLRRRRAVAVRRRVRAELGIPDGVCAVLYTPTYRDPDYYAPPEQRLELALDPGRLAAALGPGYCLLPRLHYMVTQRRAPQDQPGVVDVSYHPDVAELYLAADVLVTDYSSTMFDFAVTGKPLVFFTYDLAAYRDTIRGFYFDLEPVAPGPLVQTPAELLAVLRSDDLGQSAFRKRYRRFQDTYGHLDDGHATRRLRGVFAEAARRSALRPAVPAETPVVA